MLFEYILDPPQTRIPSIKIKGGLTSLPWSAMSRIAAQSTGLGRASLKRGLRVFPAAGNGVVVRATRQFSANAPGFHQHPVDPNWRHHQARFGGLAAVAVAGSVSLLVLSQLKSLEDLLPSFVKEGTSTKRIEDVSTSQLAIVRGHSRSSSSSIDGLHNNA